MEKRFEAIVTRGENKGETGYVTDLSDKVVTFYTDKGRDPYCLFLRRNQIKILEDN